MGRPFKYGEPTKCKRVNQPISIWNALDKEKERTGRPMYEMIREAILDFLKKRKDNGSN